MKDRDRILDKRGITAARIFMIMAVLSFVIGGMKAGSLSAIAAEHAGDENKTIYRGVKIGNVDVGGMTRAQARDAVEAYLQNAGASTLTLRGDAEGKSVTVTPEQLGLYWTNPEVVEEAAGIGKDGNIIQRYKSIKDTEHNGASFPMTYDIAEDLTREFLETSCHDFDQPAKDYRLKREGGAFVIEDGQTGFALNETASVENIRNYLENDWDFADGATDLVIDVDQPKGSEAELGRVRDLLGTFTTTYKTSGASRCTNIANGCRLASGQTLYPGDEFDMLKSITPFTEANGYEMAGSYLQGIVVESFGGGICQVSTTLYNAVLKAELEVTERHNHSMIVTYVDPSRDAAIAENGGKNFRFVNNTEGPIYIDGYTEGKSITFNIYGVESRDAGRKVSYESETLSTTEPGPDKIVADGSAPVGSVHTQGAHKGIKAQLWKVVTENGVEKSRDVINSSNYQMVPRIITIGTASSNPVLSQMMNAAIATQDTETAKAQAAAIAAQAAAEAADPSLRLQDPAAAPAEGTPAEGTPGEGAAVEGTPAESTQAPEQVQEQAPAEAVADEVAVVEASADGV